MMVPFILMMVDIVKVTVIIGSVKQHPLASSGGETMRVSREEKDAGHERIVTEASRLLRRRGVEATGVADVMTAAGRTHGGFYRHFPNKQALVAAAVDVAFE